MWPSRGAAARAGFLAIAAADILADATARASAGRSWAGSLELEFEHRRERTIVARRRHRGPIMVQSAFHPEGPVCHVYVLHPPGGMVGGDRLDLVTRSTSGSHALITTPASAKLYRSAGEEAVVTQRLRVAAGAALEFLPAEAIVFDGARCRTRTLIDLERGARMLGWDAWIFGRPASGLDFMTGHLRQTFEVTLDGRALLSERNHVPGGGDWLKSPWGLGGRAACATLVAYPAQPEDLEVARGACGRDARSDAAATLMDGLLVCRVIAAGMMALRARIEAWWRLLRPRIVGVPACAPRIWAT